MYVINHILGRFHDLNKNILDFIRRNMFFVLADPAMLCFVSYLHIIASVTTETLK